MLTQLYYADFTQIIYAIHYAFYAVITQIIYADFTQIIYAIQLRSLRNSITQIHLRNYHNFFTQFTQIPVFITQVYAKGNLLMNELRNDE